QQPGIIGVLDDKHAAQRQVADVDSVLGELGMQRPVGGHFVSRLVPWKVADTWPANNTPSCPALGRASTLFAWPKGSGSRRESGRHPACFPALLAPNRHREIGGGRATRQPGQVRKEAALTRSGSGRSSVSYLFFRANRAGSGPCPFRARSFPQAGRERLSIADRPMTDAGAPPPEDQGGFALGGPP